MLACFRLITLGASELCANARKVAEAVGHIIISLRRSAPGRIEEVAHLHQHMAYVPDFACPHETSTLALYNSSTGTAAVRLGTY